MTDVGVWFRVSTDHQASANQAPDIDRFIAHHGHAQTARYELSESAWNGGKDDGEYRATLAQALDDAWQGKFSILIVWALDRITREGAEGALRVIRQFRERGCTVVSIQESWLNGSPEIQDVLVAFAGWQAKQESDRKSARIRSGLAARKAALAAGKEVRGRQAVGGRIPGSKDKLKPGERNRRSAAVKAAWTPERKAALAERNRQRAKGAAKPS
jgi:DNA invertase Pin-like site-specific DNA recombinase